MEPSCGQGLQRTDLVGEFAPADLRVLISIYQYCRCDADRPGALSIADS
jgi:hypothetical protein